MSDTLLLNANYEPISILPLSVIGWQQAIKLIFLDRVKVVENYEDRVIRSPSTEIRLPSVCVTKEYFNPMKHVKFTRNNLYLRDMYQCQYCADVFGPRDLTIDHVIPKSKGGIISWENCVTACKECNFRKGNKIMKPLKEPVNPEYYHLVAKWRRRPGNISVRPEWLRFLHIDEQKVNVQTSR